MENERLKRITAYALSRPEAYIVVLLVFLAVLVAIIGGWPGWIIMVCIGAGVVLLGLLVVDSLGNPDAERDASIADVDPSRIRDAELRNKVRRALEYVRAAHKMIKEDTGDALASTRDELPQLEQAARSIYQMVLRLQDFRADPLLQRDTADLRKRSQQGQISMDQKEQLNTLTRLEDLVRSADQEIDSALAHLGRSYAEMQAIKVTPELRGRASDALDELDASSRRLTELAEGYDEVFSSRALPGS